MWIVVVALKYVATKTQTNVVSMMRTLLSALGRLHIPIFMCKCAKKSGRGARIHGTLWHSVP